VRFQSRFTDRKGLTSRITKEVFAANRRKSGKKNHYSCFQEDWHKGVIEIVASIDRTIDPHCFTKYDKYVASARSVPDLMSTMP
jgi:single-stranded DNA-specific DHH superfamily exonuclease